MINILFLLGLAQASDVYEICIDKEQIWSDRYQEWKPGYTRTYFTMQSPQIIVHKNSFEIDRDVHPIVERFERDGMSCFREHQNSEICYDKNFQELYWERHNRNRDVIRNVMTICKIDGSPVSAKEGV